MGPLFSKEVFLTSRKSVVVEGLKYDYFRQLLKAALTPLHLETVFGDNET